MIRLAYAVGSLGIGGAERHVLEMANHFSGKGYGVYIFCFYRSGPLEERLDRRVETMVLGKRAGNDPLLVMRMARAIRARKIDLLHSLNWGTYLESILAARAGGVGVHIHAQRGMEKGTFEGISKFRKSARYLSMRIGSSAVSRIIAVSAEIEKWVLDSWGVAPGKVLLIPNGVVSSREPAGSAQRAQFRRELGFDEDTPLIAAVGRFWPVKNYPFLLRSMATLRNLLPRARLVIAGDGPERPRLEELRRELGLEKEVKFLGWSSDVPRLLSMIDLYVISSRSEGSPQALLEAMAAGVPAVATAVGGCSEIVTHGVTGLLVPPDQPAPLAEGMACILRNGWLAASMGRSARARVDAHYSYSAMMSRYEDLYRELLEKKSSSRGSRKSF